MDVEVYIDVNIDTYLTDTDNSVVIARGKGGEGRWAKGGINGNGKRLCFG